MVEMGFPENRCKRALVFFKNKIELAMEHVMNTTTD